MIAETWIWVQEPQRDLSAEVAVFYRELIVVQDLAPSYGNGLAAARAAWREHIIDLIDQHRIAHEIDEEALFEFVLQYIDARDACTPGNYEVGLRMYEAIPLRRARGMLK